METYNSSGYGTYNISKFMIELNRTVAVPGDFHSYILSDISDALQNQNRTSEDPFRLLLNSQLLKKPVSKDSVLKSMFTIFHETTHLVQDFTLGSEILRDYLFDMISWQSFTFFNLYKMCGMQLPLPLEKLSAYENNEKTSRLQDLFDYIYNTTIRIDIPGENPVYIGSADLIEAYAAAKAFSYMIHSEPESFQNKELNLYFHNSQLSETYRNAWHVYEKSMAFDRTPYEGGPLSENRSFDMTAFLLICDISLHIPVPPFNKCLQKGYEPPEYYLPHFRFIRILQTLIENRGFPDAIAGEDFYITLFNFIAKRNNWPSFQDTLNGWCGFISERMNEGFTVSDGYRMICAFYKNNHANELIAAPPASFFIRTGVPVLVRYYKGSDSYFEYERILATLPVKVFDSQGLDPFADPYVIMTDPEYRNPWTARDFISEVNKGGVPWTFRSGLTFLREIVCRILSKEFYKAAATGTYFCCPLADLRCLAKKDTCRCLKNLTNLPGHCSLAVWLEESRLEPHTFYWR